MLEDFCKRSSEKHGGLTASDNLCYACALCNRNKGSDIGSIVAGNGGFIRFYNPREDAWPDHFEIQSFRIDFKSSVGGGYRQNPPVQHGRAIDGKRSSS